MLDKGAHYGDLAQQRQMAFDFIKKYYNDSLFESLMALENKMDNVLDQDKSLFYLSLVRGNVQRKIFRMNLNASFKSIDVSYQSIDLSNLVVPLDKAGNSTSESQ